MLQKKLASWLKSFLTWVRGVFGNRIPSVIGREERIMRTIYHPANFNTKKNKLRSNFMRPPSSPDEEDPTIMSNKLSTTRFDYTGIEFCRSHARAHQSEPLRHYWGFGRFVVEKLEKPRIVGGQEYTCKVKSKPVEDNLAHANINLGFRLQEGESLDSEIQEYIKQLADSAEILEDPTPTSEKWHGKAVDKPKYGELKYKKIEILNPAIS